MHVEQSFVTFCAGLENAALLHVSMQTCKRTICPWNNTHPHTRTNKDLPIHVTHTRVHTRAHTHTHTHRRHTQTEHTQTEHTHAHITSHTHSHIHAHTHANTEHTYLTMKNCRELEATAQHFIVLGTRASDCMHAHAWSTWSSAWAL